MFLATRILPRYDDLGWCNERRHLEGTKSPCLAAKNGCTSGLQRGGVVFVSASSISIREKTPNTNSEYWRNLWCEEVRKIPFFPTIWIVWRHMNGRKRIRYDRDGFSEFSNMPNVKRFIGRASKLRRPRIVRRVPRFWGPSESPGDDEVTPAQLSRTYEKTSDYSRRRTY